MRICINGKSQEVSLPVTLLQLLDDLRLERSSIAVEVNGQLIPREQHGDHRLADNDLIEIVTLVGGG